MEESLLAELVISFEWRTLAVVATIFPHQAFFVAIKSLTGPHSLLKNMQSCTHSHAASQWKRWSNVHKVLILKGLSIKALKVKKRGWHPTKLRIRNSTTSRWWVLNELPEPSISDLLIFETLLFSSLSKTTPSALLQNILIFTSKIKFASKALTNFATCFFLVELPTRPAPYLKCQIDLQSLHLSCKHGWSFPWMSFAC